MIVKPFLIVSATSFNFAVMPRCSRMNRFVMHMKLCAQPVKGVYSRRFLCVAKFTAVVCWYDFRSISERKDCAFYKVYG